MEIITTSPNIATLDALLIADQCNGNFLVDLSPSVWIASGEDNVLGAKVKMTNPYGVVVRDYPDNYDVTPAFSGGMEAVTSIPIPTQAGTYQYGKYTISVQLTDADGTTYEVTKVMSICAPTTADKGKKYGNLGAKLTGVCNQGKVYVLVDEVPTYKGLIAESTSQGFTLDYPTGSGLSPIADTPQGSFSVQLFEGVYKIAGSVCATYNYGDNVYAKVSYQVNYSKSIICSLDESCVFTGLAALYEKINSDCSEEEKKDTQNRIERTAILRQLIDSGIQAGEDVSDYILDLEDVLGQTCSCDFNNGTPIVNNDPSNDILIQGCNVEKEEVGLTTIYTIDNYSYTATVASNGGLLTVSNVVLNGCVKSQNFTFNIANAYNQIKQLANSNLAEAQSWAAIVMKSLTSIDATCLGLTSQQLAVISLNEFIQKIVDKVCAGAGCSSTIDSLTTSQDGGDVIAAWTETNAFSLDVYIDGIFVATVLSSSSSYRLNGLADGLTHTIRVVSKCSNGIFGAYLQTTFGYEGCPAINPPTVSSANIANASCPFDLTGLVSGLPTGIQAEWHTNNNHLPSSLLANPTSVSDGVYYVFATDGDNCYSTGVKVIVTCSVSSSCSAPQNLSAGVEIGGIKVSFKSALYPPPSNSYTVKRKPAASSDVDASYTTIGTPTFNVSTGKWEIVDKTAAANTLYTYKATSNCDTPQSVTYNFANIYCPSLALTSDGNNIYYSFTGTGGQIDKYEVEIWDSSGSELIHTDTYLTLGAISGQFTYLDPATTYKVRIVPFIGTDSFPCAFSTKATAGNNYTLSPSFNLGINSVTGTGVPSLPPTGTTGNEYGHHTAISGTLTIDVFGSVVTTTKLTVYVNGVTFDCTAVPDVGEYTLNCTAAESDDVRIAIESGSC